MRESCLSPSLQNLEKATEVNFARISNRFLTNWFIDPTLKNGSNAIVCGEIRLPIVQGSNLELSDLDFDVRLALKSLVVRGRWNQMISRYRNLKGNYVCWSHSDTTDRLVSLSDNHQSDNVTNFVSQSKCIRIWQAIRALWTLSNGSESETVHTPEKEQNLSRVCWF